MYFADAVGLGADGALEGTALALDRFRLILLVGGFEALPGFARKLGVDGQEALAGVGGKADGVLHPLGGAGLDVGVFEKLSGSEHLAQQHAELHFGEAAAGFDVGEDAREVVDAFGELGHLAEAGVDLVELVGDLPEGLGEAGVEGGVQLFVDGGAHLFELGGVVGVEAVEAVLDGGAELVLMFGVGGGEFVELGVERGLGVDLVARGVGDEAGEPLGERLEVLLDSGAKRFGGGLVVAAEAVEAGVQRGAESGDALQDFDAQGAGGGFVGFGIGAKVGAEFGADLGERGAGVAVEGLGAGVDAGKLLGKLAEPGIGLRMPAQKQSNNGDQDGDLQDHDSEGHVRFSFAIA